MIDLEKNTEIKNYRKDLRRTWKEVIDVYLTLFKTNIYSVYYFQFQKEQILSYLIIILFLLYLLRNRLDLNNNSAYLFKEKNFGDNFEIYNFSWMDISVSLLALPFVKDLIENIIRCENDENFSVIKLSYVKNIRRKDIIFSNHLFLYFHFFLINLSLLLLAESFLGNWKIYKIIFQALISPLVIYFSMITSLKVHNKFIYFLASFLFYVISSGTTQRIIKEISSYYIAMSLRAILFLIGIWKIKSEVDEIDKKDF